MNRRTYLGAAASGLAAFAGCSSVDLRDGNGSARDGTPSTPTPPRLADTTLPVPRSELTFAAPKDVFAAIVDPVFGPDWAGVELPGYGGDGATPRLRPGDRVVGVVRDGEARAYPLRLLDDHEVVNDDFGGPLLVTYCPLCGSGVTAERLVAGAPTRFGVSGKLWHSDLVMYDERTGSYWSQILATAIRGPRTGDRLALVPSTLTTWEQWRRAHPETVVLRPPPESRTIDGSGAQFYSDPVDEPYRRSDVIGVGQNDFDDDRLLPKAEVIGISYGESARAYPLFTVIEAGAINDTVGGLPVVVSHAKQTLVAYDRRIDGHTLRFRRGDDGTLQAGGSTWDMLSGRALDGTFEGSVLRRANEVTQLLWFAWAQHHPKTTVYGH
jgi:hypothetical protein